jgi:hypothetical protein
MSGDLDDITKQFGEAATDALRRAYDVGFRAGERYAKDTIRQKLGSIFLEADIEARATTTADLSADDAATVADSARAAPGSIKPRILHMVSDTPGITNKKIEDASGIKPNTVRGTLWTLTQEGKVERRGKGWFPISSTEKSSKENPGGDTPGPINLFK